MKNLRFLTVVSLLFLVCGCVSTSQARSLRGTYEVPTDDPALKDSNIHDVFYENPGDFLRDNEARFKLPATLVGQPIEYKVVLDQRAGANGAGRDTWKGQGIDQMNCELVKREYTCNVKFTPKTIVLDELAIEQALKAKNPEIAQASVMKFMSVSREFADDPIGILRYEVRGGDENSFMYKAP